MLAALLGLVAAGPLACASGRAVACASDLDCGATTACDQGRCVSPSSVEPPDLRPQRVVVRPRDDGTVLSATCCQTTSYGGHDSLVVGGAEGGQVYRSYLRFQTPRWSKAEVVRAHLRLVAQPRWSQGSEPFEVLVFGAPSGWTQTGLTWVSQPGGRGQPMGRAVIRPSHNGVTVIEVSELVRRWAASSSEDHALLLRTSNERTNLRVVYFSVEANDPAKRPRLEVEIR